MKLLLFDLDGTLVKTGAAGLKALDRAFETFCGLTGAMAGINAAGKTDPWIFEEVFRMKLLRGPSAWEAERIASLYLEYLREGVPHSHNYRVMPGARDLLEALASRRDALLALGTGNLEEGARIKLARADLNRYFSFGGFGSDHIHRPAVLKAAVERARRLVDCHLHPRDVVVIGDTALDVAAGRAIGAVTVGVSNGDGHLSGLEESRPDILINTLEEFLEKAKEHLL